MQLIFSIVLPQLTDLHDKLLNYHQHPSLIPTERRTRVLVDVRDRVESGFCRNYLDIPKHCIIKWYYSSNVTRSPWDCSASRQSHVRLTKYLALPEARSRKCLTSNSGRLALARFQNHNVLPHLYLEFKALTTSLPYIRRRFNAKIHCQLPYKVFSNLPNTPTIHFRYSLSVCISYNTPIHLPQFQPSGVTDHERHKLLTDNLWTHRSPMSQKS